jgi:hypothetical protein
MEIVNLQSGNYLQLYSLSSVNAIHCMDVNDDGYPGLIVGGSQFYFGPQRERLDAGTGDILIDNSKGDFKLKAASETGLKIAGELRDIAEIHGRDQTYLLFLQNDEFPVLYISGTKTGKDMKK